MRLGINSSRRAGQPWQIVAVLAFAGMGSAFMHTILVPIQGELPELLGVGRDQTAWVITATLLTSAICTPISGKLGDMFGKRRIALVLLGLLVAGSVIAALSPTIGPLIVGRALQGTGMGVIPLGISMLRDLLPVQLLGTAVSLVSATMGVGGALGLPISAFVTERFDWHLLFWVAAGIGTVALLLLAAVIPPGGRRSGGRLDLVGAGGLALGLLGVLLAISRGNAWGWFSGRTLALLLGGILVLLLWGRYQLRVKNPLIDLRASAKPPVLFTNLASVAMGFALFSSNVAFPQLLSLPLAAGGLGLSLLAASFVLMPSGLAMLVMSPVSGRLQRTIGAKPLLVAGACVLAVAYTIAVFVDIQVWHVLLINLIIGIGIGLGFAAMPALIMQVVPASTTAAANGINTLMRALGTSTAAAAIAVVLAASAAPLGDLSFPSREGFQTAFLFGLAAAVLCAAIAMLIPVGKETSTAG